MGFNCLNVTDPLQGDSLLFITKSPVSPGTHLIDLENMKGLVDLGAKQCLWTRYHWIWNPAPWPFTMALGPFFFFKFPTNQIVYIYNILVSQSSIMLIFVLIYMQEKMKLIVTQWFGDLKFAQTCQNLCKIPIWTISLFG